MVQELSSHLAAEITRLCSLAKQDDLPLNQEMCVYEMEVSTFSRTGWNSAFYHSECIHVIVTPIKVDGSLWRSILSHCSKRLSDGIRLVSPSCAETALLYMATRCPHCQVTSQMRLSVVY